MLLGMTNETQRTSTDPQRAGRAITVAAGAASCLLLWAINGPLTGHDLAVQQGDTRQQIGPVAVVATALVAGLVAWALLAALERFTRRPIRIYRIIALVVLVVSLAGPLDSGAGTSSRLALLGMHLTVGAALIIGLPSRRNGC